MQAQTAWVSRRTVNERSFLDLDAKNMHMLNDEPAMRTRQLYNGKHKTTNFLTACQNKVEGFTLPKSYNELDQRVVEIKLKKVYD